jgi:hypothetical protein
VDGSGRGERRGDDARGEPADTGDGAQEAAVADRPAAAAAELYGSDLEAFTDRRKVLAAEARSAGDKAAATAIAALRKPTRAAWVVNRLARDDPAAPPRLAAVAAGLRAAEQAKDGPRLRELSLARGTLLDALTEQALTAAGFPDPPPSLRAEVVATLTAALADPAVAEAFAAGTLTRAAHWSGFGDAILGPADLATADSAPADPAPADPVPADPAPAEQDGLGRGDPVRAPVRSRAPLTAVPATASGRRTPAPAPPAAPRRVPHPPAARDSRPPAAARAAADDDQRRVREAAERAARQRKNYEDAERTVASAATVAAEALAGEDRLEAEVRDLEERLIQTRADLAAARLSARRAEAAERRARQALDRLPRA